tara:strand:+ start:86 stop:280 length:195 start_codon:yes stop_codon:yes gene_type:complete
MKNPKTYKVTYTETVTYEKTIEAETEHKADEKFASEYTFPELSCDTRNILDSGITDLKIQLVKN